MRRFLTFGCATAIVLVPILMIYGAFVAQRPQSGQPQGPFTQR